MAGLLCFLAYKFLWQDYCAFRHVSNKTRGKSGHDISRDFCTSPAVLH